MAALKPGDAKTSPFGDGSGGAGMSGGKGNDFVKNPGGSGSKKGGGQPESYGESREQKKGADPQAPGDKAEGGETAAEVQGAGTPKSDETIGTLVEKAAHKPFKLSGG